MREVSEQFRMERLTGTVEELQAEGIPDEEEGAYLKYRINDLYRR